MAPNDFALVSPRAILAEIASAVPDACKANVIIIGSLAVGYHFLGNSDAAVRTKDADCLLVPRAQAVPAAKALTEQLIAAGWTYRTDAQFPAPGTSATETDRLPVIRLHPPHGSAWFIELLTTPPIGGRAERRFERVETAAGHFGLCSFGFLSIPGLQPLLTDTGLSIARPEMMALANLLEHRTIRPQVMSGLIGGRSIKRANKDLGRVMAIAWLTLRDPEADLRIWARTWREALAAEFPGEYETLIRTCGDGLRQLLERPDDLDEAWYTCANGLLATSPPTRDELKIAGVRLLSDAVEPMVGALG